MTPEKKSEFISGAGSRILDLTLATMAEQLECRRDDIGLCLIICTELETEDGQRVQVFGNMRPADVADLCSSLVERYKSGGMNEPPDSPH